MTNKGNCCVLFPDSKVARTSEQFLLSQRQQRRGLIESPGRRINSSMLNIDVVGSREESELGEAETNYTQDEQTRFTSNTAAAVSTAATTSRTATTIVVVDGTWKDARKMNLEIPNWIPRIKLSSSSRAKFINMRKHHVEGQVSTMSAFLHLLTEVLTMYHHRQCLLLLMLLLLFSLLLEVEEIFSSPPLSPTHSTILTHACNCSLESLRKF